MCALLRMEGITKRFPGVLANDNVTLEVQAGQVHALLGENGAGKTTLMNILYGLYGADSGCIYLRDKRSHITSPSSAIAQGIGMVHQHFMLVPTFSVAENIILGTPLPGEPFLDLKQVEREIRELSRQHNLDVDARAVIGDLPVGIRQRVEILKALYRNADLLVLDEPTAVLTPGEVRDLFRIICSLTSKGKSVIFISHKLEEVMEISDQITVLRDGKVVASVERDNTDKASLARMMVGRDVVFRVSRSNPERHSQAILEVDGLNLQDEHGKAVLSDVSFDVKAGEIFAIAGVDGNGQRELAATVSGLQKPSRGKVLMQGQDVAKLGAKRLAERGVARIPEDRHELGLVLDFTVAENLILDSVGSPPNSFLSFLNFRAVREQAARLCEEYDIRPSQPERKARLLSGGNQQKVVLARELCRKPVFILAFRPSRGLDVGATEYVYRCLLEQRDQNAAILLISTELDEIHMLADRIAVLFEGRVMGIIENERTDLEQIGLMMAGTPLSEIETANPLADFEGCER